MAYWDGEKKKIVYSCPRIFEDFPGWVAMDCGCCMGNKWGGDYPVQCKRCHSGFFALHVQSGIGSLYPGGPFNGVNFTTEASARILEQAHAHQRA